MKTCFCVIIQHDIYTVLLRKIHKENALNNFFSKCQSIKKNFFDGFKGVPKTGSKYQLSLQRIKSPRL